MNSTDRQKHQFSHFSNINTRDITRFFTQVVAELEIAGIEDLEDRRPASRRQMTTPVHSASARPHSVAGVSVLDQPGTDEQEGVIVTAANAPPPPPMSPSDR